LIQVPPSKYPASLIPGSQVTVGERIEQIRNATSFPDVKLVVITPDVHFGYGVPVGCIILTDYESGAVAMGP